MISGGISQGLRKMSQANYSSDLASIAAKATLIFDKIIQGTAYGKVIGSICFEEEEEYPAFRLPFSIG